MEESIRHTANEDRNGESPRYQPRESPRYHQKAEEEINYRGSYNEQQFRQMEAQERRLEAELGLTDGSRGKDGQDSTKYQRV